MSTNLWRAPALVSREIFLLVAWIGWSLATVCVLGRIATRLSVFKRLLTDDYFVLLAWASSLCFSILWHVKSRDAWEAIDRMAGKVPMDELYLRYSYDYITVQTGAIVTQTVGLWSIKFSFMFFFRKMGNQIRQQHILWWVIMVYVILTMIFALAFTPWKCHDASNLAKTSIECSTPSSGKFAMDVMKLQAAADITSEAAILIIPLTIVWQIRLDIRRKLLLSALFAMTLFIIVCAISRTIVVQRTAVGVYLDVTWLYLWFKVEMDTAIVVACLASFRALFTAQRDRLLPTHQTPVSPTTNYNMGNSIRLNSSMHNQNSDSGSLLEHPAETLSKSNVLLRGTCIIEHRINRA